VAHEGQGGRAAVDERVVAVTPQGESRVETSARVEPAIHTDSIDFVARMSSSGFFVRTMKSAALPGSSVPTVLATPMQRAASLVADTSACIGVSPASTISASSMCSK
jgi:hypothetical protein